MELEHLDVVSRCIGQTLNPQERSNLEIGLLQRKTTESLASIRFWGRLHGETNDYLIAVGVLSARDYPKKKFYFCTNSSPELQQFPELTKHKADAAAKLTTRLKGDPTLVLTASGEDQSQNPEDGDSPFTELDRLAYIVDQIDRAVSIVPLEAYVVSPMRQVVANPAFHGLKWEQAIQPYNYFHFREPELPEKVKALHNSEGLVRAGDFLDPLIQDLDGSWSITRDNTGRYVTLRNFIYPGSFFFHEPESHHYGAVYFGDGRKNPDIAFML
ncbi:hypothetical protein Poli38472_011376 [Pythium oligandrum]|uniref:Radial spoke head protein 9 homolog n=1 Tax=Pythium oligandrum TaxID=41045 RepID=A0A8K1CKN9_PYTOL|nr:hypothetical protein Poli38472_011376 [Pythium oligandrum]|eukprot:TMW64496.1 hypothetical protein Poli38472_011376 [Pythium oligandrum]